MPDLDSSLPDWLIDVPGSALVFQRYNLDTSCGGKSLDYVCREVGLDPHQVLAELQALQQPSTDSTKRSQAFRHS
jgi:iron-sulfur cluster repair protein YtfE (RIC family)